MRILFVGGTGLLSGACTLEAMRRGHEVVHLNRGRHPSDLSVITLVADVRDEAAARAALGRRTFDVVVDFVAFRPADIDLDLRLFDGRAGQFVFVSSATVYEKPLRRWPIREDWPLANPFSEYARDKIACEERLRQAIEGGFPGAIIRPSHTYDERSIPLAVRSLQHPFTSIARMRAGKPVIVPGDGSSLWTLTYVSDFAVGLVGLLGQRDITGRAVNIMSGEALPWEEIYAETAKAADAPFLPVHMPSEFIAACLPDIAGRLLGDASVTAVFDITELRRLVPEFRPAVPFAEGIRRAIDWFDADPSRQTIDWGLDQLWDRLIAAFDEGLETARRRFADER